MWRTRRFWLWATATILCLLPLTISWWIPQEWLYFNVLSSGEPPPCLGLEARDAVWGNPIVSAVAGWDSVVVPAAFAVWLPARERRAGWVAGALAVAYITVQVAIDAAFIAFDLLLSEGCGQTWGPLAAWSIGFGLYRLLAALLIMIAIRGGGPRSARARATRRVLVVTAVIAALVIAAVTDQRQDTRFTGRAVDAEECYDWTVVHRAYGDTAPKDRELAFLCMARDATGYVGRLIRLPDRELLTYGRALCGVAHLPSTDPMTRKLLDQAGADDWSHSLMSVLVFLCPDAVGRTWPELVLSEAEGVQREKDYQTKQTSYCTDPRARPRARRQATTALFVSEGGGYGITDAGVEAGEGVTAGLETAFDNGVVGAYDDSATIRTEVENSSVCLTVKAYTQAPPIATRGWDRIVETGIRSPSGELNLWSWDGSEPLPNLAAAGPGRYRIRVSVRNQEKADLDTSGRPVEEHLVEVFPGRSTRTVTRHRAER
ncbi:hypothetical protein SAMN05216276_101017 [Streptosporangium subroseum]|uniref:Uncharacterized protein n=1 Tax=Streptosporangium subroseum TaxID=106412 RepID=A0A239EQS5_9ACTN|nr:hypothetical protein [Streptosporangium subroseum]SNS46929.1 hypothetical protein SAMN05216276_101017 [Streptosporangium subroseum]